MSDSVLDQQDKADIKIEIDYQTEGQSELGVSDHDKDAIVLFVHEMGFCSKKFFSADVTRILEGAFFAFGSRTKNPAWKEHMSSLREFCEKWSDNDGVFKQVKRRMGRSDEYKYMEISEEDRDVIERLSRSIGNYYSYLSGILHSNQGQVIQSWRRIEDSGIEPGTEAFKDENFIRVVKKFFEDIVQLQSLIKKHEST